MPRCYIALGGNQGPVADRLDRAVELLGRDLTLVARSRNFRTAPVGAAAGETFLNAALAVETDLSPLDVLELLHRTEETLERVRAVHWGPRTIDLDLILYGDAVLHEPRLRVPHPACWYRRFVLDPLCDIAPDVVHPERGVTFAALRDRLRERPLPVALVGGTTENRAALRQTLAARFPQTGVDDAPDADVESAALVVWLGGDSVEEDRFGTLPPASRLDLSAAGAATAEVLGDVLSAALDEPIAS